MANPPKRYTYYCHILSYYRHIRTPKVPQRRDGSKGSAVEHIPFIVEEMYVHSNGPDLITTIQLAMSVMEPRV